MIGFIENFDSFSYNLVHYLRKAGGDVVIFENHELSKRWSELEKCDAFLIGPGPNEPENSGDLMRILERLVDLKKPILGVCLGHQALGQFFGWTLRRAKEPVHGKSSVISHSGDAGSGLFNGLPQELQVGRYHSLVVDDASFGVSQLEVLARAEDHEIMAFQHKSAPIFGVQFHPESVLTPKGQELINNWLSLVRMASASNSSSL